VIKQTNKQLLHSVSLESESTIVVNGKTYQYDYDYDCYYRVHNTSPETPRERWTKIAVALVVLILVIMFSHFVLHN
jgi:hypothetical protein